MSSITVTPNLQTKSVSSSTSAQTITPDSGYCRLRQVNISASDYHPCIIRDISALKGDFSHQSTPRLTYSENYYYSFSSENPFPTSSYIHFFGMVFFSIMSESSYIWTLTRASTGEIFDRNSSPQKYDIATTNFWVSSISSRQFVYQNYSQCTCYMSNTDGTEKVNVTLQFTTEGGNYFNLIPENSIINITVYYIIF